jgi:hypothetical protein
MHVYFGDALQISLASQWELCQCPISIFSEKLSASNFVIKQMLVMGNNGSVVFGKLRYSGKKKCNRFWGDLRDTLCSNDNLV